MTKTLQLVTGLYRRLGHPLADDAELKQMLGPLDVHGIENRLLAEIDRTSKARTTKDGPSIGKRERAKQPNEEGQAQAPSPPPAP